MQMRTISPSWPYTFPFLRSRTWPEQSFPMQVWQIPSRQPNWRSRPASSPATRMGLPPSAVVSQSLAAKVMRPPSPSSWRASFGWNRPCGEVAVPLPVPVLGHGVEQVPGTREKSLALAPVGTEVVEVLRLDPLFLAGQSQRHAVAVVAGLEALELLTEDDPLRGAGRVDVDAIRVRTAPVEVAEHAHDRGDAAAGAEEQRLFRGRVRHHEAALDAAEADDVPGPGPLDEVGRDLAGVDQLGRDADQPVGTSRLRGEEYARQWKTPSTTTPTRVYCPGLCPGHS